MAARKESLCCSCSWRRRWLTGMAAFADAEHSAGAGGRHLLGEVRPTKAADMRQIVDDFNATAEHDRNIFVQFVSMSQVERRR